MKEYLINMSGVYAEEGFSPAGATSVDCTRLEGTNCYCSPDSGAILRSTLGKLPLEAVHWIDTGDYHYLSAFFLERIREPFQLILFDHHPDRQDSAFGSGLLSCGNWVAESIRNCGQMLRNVHTIGTDDGSRHEDGLPVYLSIDLDILAPAEFRTDWTQGDLSLKGLTSLLGTIIAKDRVLGIDFCGGITRSKGASDRDLDLNRAVRERLSALYGTGS